MDPVSIVMLTNASLGIARSLVHTINELYELAEKYETAALGIRTVAMQCNSFRVAIQRISKWLTSQDESSRHNLDDDFWQALADNLDTGTLVLDDLEKRIKGLKKDSAKFWTRTKYLWNSGVISELQSQIQGLMSAVSILIQVIEMPTAGGRRSQSLAQRSRLNNITKSVRQTVDQRRERIQTSQEQSLLDEVDSEPIPSNLQQPLLSSETGLKTNSSAPPPYGYYESDTYEARKGDVPPQTDAKKSPEISESTFRVLDRSGVMEEKSKRSKWTLGFKKRSSTPKVDQVSRSSSGPIYDSPKDATQPSTTPTILDPFDDSNAAVQQTPAPLDTSNDTDQYFGLQTAMAGMSMPTPLQASSGGFHDEQSGQEVSTDSLTKIPSIVGPPVGTESSQSALPSRTDALRTSSGYGGLGPLPTEMSRPAGAQPSKDKTTSAYYPPPLEPARSNTRSPPTSPPTTNAIPSPQPSAFERIRPSQRVRESRERSLSRDPTRNLAASLDSLSTPLALTPSLPTIKSTSDIVSQTWRTTSSTPASTLSTSSHLRIKITYDPTLYTSRISTSAARALHLLEHALTNTIDHVPIATLNLLYTVSDGESQSVMGDEVELEVMHEEDCRGMEIVFGAAQVHVGGIMEGSEGGVIWWSERAVPRGLRTLEGLRLFRRFELSRW